MECFVEFFSYGDASAAVNKLIRGREQEGRHLKLGDRHVDVELSSQEALMKELFPRARNVEWKGARPTIVKSDDPFDSGFKGFLSGEDTVMMVKYAEQPHRVSNPFVYHCLVLYTMIIEILRNLSVLIYCHYAVWLQPEVSTSYIRVHDKYFVQGRLLHIPPSVNAILQYCFRQQLPFPTPNFISSTSTTPFYLPTPKLTLPVLANFCIPPVSLARTIDLHSGST